MPKISFVMPVYNCGPYVEAAVRSLLDQTEPDIEVIAVDDGSTDESPRILAQISASDSRLVVVSQQNFGNASHARNVGIARARGDYIAFLDADDLAHPARAQASLAALADCPSAALVFHDHTRFRVGLHGVDALPYLRGINYLSHSRECWQAVGANLFMSGARLYHFSSLNVVGIHTNTIMVRRHVFDGHQPLFRTDLLVCHDTFLWLQLLRDHPCAFLDESLSYYRVREGSLTARSRTLAAETVTVHTENLAANRSLFTPEEAALYGLRISGEWFCAGYERFVAGDVRASRAAYAESLRWSWRPRTAVAWLKTFVPRYVVESLRRTPDLS